MRRLLSVTLLAWARRLRHPTLFKLAGGLFLVTLFLPDPIPFVDEIVLAMLTMALASWKKQTVVTDVPARLESVSTV